MKTTTYQSTEEEVEAKSDSNKKNDNMFGTKIKSGRKVKFPSRFV